MRATRLGKTIVRGAFFGALLSRAARYAKNPDEMTKLIGTVRKKIDAAGGGGGLGGVLGILQTFLRLIRSYASGKYRDLKWQSLVTVVAAVLYFLTPIDVIPDFFLGVGYLDDAAVLAWVAGTVSSELEKFRRWESENVNP